MMISANSEKGYALILALVFIIILIASSIGLYAISEHIIVETRVKETEYIRGYYAALAGLRYAAILLRDPGAFFTDAPHDGEFHVVPSDDPFFENNPEFDSSDLTEIRITEWSNGVTDPEWQDGEYQVSATYSY